MKKLAGLVGFAVGAFVLPACGDNTVDGFATGFRSRLTGEPCVPNADTFVASDDITGALSANASDRAHENARERAEAVAARRGALPGAKRGDAAAKPEKQEGLVSNPLGLPGDNEDDSRSGLTDCLGDGNSGHGDDFKHGECEPTHDDPPPPAQGCDDLGCCDVLEDPSADPADSPTTDPNGEVPPDLNEDCSYLDDACGRGVLETDSRVCYYLPTGWCEG